MKNTYLRILFTLCLLICAHGIHAQIDSQKDTGKFVGPLDSALVQLLKLDPQEFVKDSKSTPSNVYYGFQIEAFEKVFPSMVSTKYGVVKIRSIGKYQRSKTIATKYINYASLVPVLVAAMQEQQALIIKQQQQIEALQKLIHP